MTKFLVSHEYGMGALYWWIEANSPEEIIQTYAEVRVIDQDSIDVSNFSDIESLRLGAPAPAGLEVLEDQRRRQRSKPGYGALAGRGSIYIKQDFPAEQETYFLEFDGNGYRTRQVTVSVNGYAERSGPENWLFNPPEDLWNPELAPCEITRDEFEHLWAKSEPLA